MNGYNAKYQVYANSFSFEPSSQSLAMHDLSCLLNPKVKVYCPYRSKIKKYTPGVIKFPHLGNFPSSFSLHLYSVTLANPSSVPDKVNLQPLISRFVCILTIRRNYRQLAGDESKTIVSTTALCASHYPGHVLFKRCQIHQQASTLRGCGRKKRNRNPEVASSTGWNGTWSWAITGLPGMSLSWPPCLSVAGNVTSLTSPHGLRATSTLGRYPHADFKHGVHTRINSLLSRLSSALNVEGKLINKPPVYPLTLLACK